MAKLLILSLPNLSRCDSSSSRSTIRDLKGRFVVLLHAIIHGKIVKKNFFLVSSLSKSSPPSSLDSSKILSHVSRYFIYIYRNIIIFTTLPCLAFENLAKSTITYRLIPSYSRRLFVAVQSWDGRCDRRGQSIRIER